MNDEHRHFLSLMRQPPARLNAEQTAWLLNCQRYDIPVLMAARLLKPLGDPAVNGTKWFATIELIELARDRSWLAKVTHALQRYWQGKNGNKRP